MPDIEGTVRTSSYLNAIVGKIALLSVSRRAFRRQVGLHASSGCLVPFSQY